MRRKVAVPERARRSESPLLERIAAIVLSALSIFWLAAFLIVAIARSVYPYELEWLEGAMLTGVRRVLAGAPLYAAPTLDYVPLNYTPVYFWVAAAFARVFGGDFLALRAVSILSTLGVLALSFDFVRRETGSRLGGLVAAGLFCACYGLSGSWLDIARADALYVFLLLGGAYVLRRFASDTRGALVAGILWSLAFLTKQSAAVVLVPLAAWLLVRRQWPALLAPLVAAVLSIAAYFTLNSTSGGWFRFYVFDVPAAYRPELKVALGFPKLILMWLTPAFLAFGLTALRRREVLTNEALAFHALWFAGLLLSSWHLASYRGGYNNVALTVCLGASLLGGLAWGTRDRSARAWDGIAVASLLAFQLGIIAWNPMNQVPRERDRRAAEELVSALRSEPATMLMPSHPDLLRRAGKPERAHFAPLVDVVKGNSGDVGRALWAEVRDSLDAHAWQLLVLDNNDLLGGEAMNAGYQLAGRAVPDADVMWPVAGMRTRPEWIMVAPSADSTVAGLR